MSESKALNFHRLRLLPSSSAITLKCSSCVLRNHNGRALSRHRAESYPHYTATLWSECYHLHLCPEEEKEVQAGTTKFGKPAAELTTKDHNSASGASPHLCRCLDALGRKMGSRKARDSGREGEAQRRGLRTEGKAQHLHHVLHSLGLERRA